MFIAYISGCIIGLIFGLSVGYSLRNTTVKTLSSENINLQKEVHRLNRLV